MRNQRMAFLLAFMSVALFGRSLAGADDKESLLELRKEKLAAAKEWMASISTAYDSTGVEPQDMYVVSIALKSAEYELASSNRERLAALSDHKARMDVMLTRIHALSVARAKGGEPDKQAATKYWVDEAKIWILEEKAKP